MPMRWDREYHPDCRHSNCCARLYHLRDLVWWGIQGRMTFIESQCQRIGESLPCPFIRDPARDGRRQCQSSSGSLRPVTDPRSQATHEPLGVCTCGTMYGDLPVAVTHCTCNTDVVSAPSRVSIADTRLARFPGDASREQ
jgi:hypothetical protein